MKNKFALLTSLSSIQMVSIPSLKLTYNQAPEKMPSPQKNCELAVSFRLLISTSLKIFSWSPPRFQQSRHSLTFFSNVSPIFSTWFSGDFRSMDWSSPTNNRVLYVLKLIHSIKKQKNYSTTIVIFQYLKYLANILKFLNVVKPISIETWMFRMQNILIEIRHLWGFMLSAGCSSCGQGHFLPRARPLGVKAVPW